MPTTQPSPVVPPDDLNRSHTLARPDSDRSLPHIGVAGGTYTITVPGEATAGRFSIIDMHIPPGGGPPPHRHDFEETFVLLTGEMEATFRGQKITVKAGETLHVPANAPHHFKNIAAQPLRMLCICSPAGQEKFFMEVGVAVESRTTAPPELEPAQRAAFLRKVQELSSMYRTELLPVS